MALTVTRYSGNQTSGNNTIYTVPAGKRAKFRFNFTVGTNYSDDKASGSNPPNLSNKVKQGWMRVAGRTVLYCSDSNYSAIIAHPYNDKLVLQVYSGNTNGTMGDYLDFFFSGATQPSGSHFIEQNLEILMSAGQVVDYGDVGSFDLHYDFTIIEEDI